MPSKSDRNHPRAWRCCGTQAKLKTFRKIDTPETHFHSWKSYRGCTSHCIHTTRGLSGYSMGRVRLFDVHLCTCLFHWHSLLAVRNHTTLNSLQYRWRYPGMSFLNTADRAQWRDHRCSLNGFASCDFLSRFNSDLRTRFTMVVNCLFSAEFSTLWQVCEIEIRT